MKLSLNIKLGLVAGIINIIAWYLFATSIGYYSLKVDYYRYFVTMGLTVCGVFISIYYERKNMGGFIPFKNALKCAILFVLVLALCLGLFNYIYYNFIAVDAIDYFLNDARGIMQKGGLKEEEILKNLGVVKSYFSPFRMFMSTMIMGVILSLLAGAILRKKAPTEIFSEN